MTIAPSVLVPGSDDEGVDMDHSQVLPQGVVFLACVDPDPKLNVVTNRKKAASQRATEMIPNSESEDESNDSGFLVNTETGGRSADGESRVSTQLLNTAMDNALPPSTPVTTTELLESGHVHGKRSDSTTSPHKCQEEPVRRAYPLRERSFAQKMPYTADRQKHRRLAHIGGVNLTGLSSSAKDKNELNLLDEAPLQNKSDVEDTDDEEYQPDLSQTPLPGVQPDMSQSLSMTPMLGDSTEEEDELPSLEEIQNRLLSGKPWSTTRPRKGLRRMDKRAHTTPKSKESARMLSSNTKRSLQKLVSRQVEPLLPPDVPEQEPFEPVKKALSRTYKGRSRRSLTKNDSPQQSSATTKTSDGSNIPHDVTDDSTLPSLDDSTVQSQHTSEDEHPQGADTHGNQNAIEIDDEDPSESLLISSSHKKKTKRVRQHVLPASFFKRNKLPDDQNVLMSMRSQIMRRRDDSDSASSSRRPKETPHTNLPHHARTRIAPRETSDRDSLKDFMAQLAQEKSDSEESENSISEKRHASLHRRSIDIHSVRPYKTAQVIDLEESDDSDLDAFGLPFEKPPRRKALDRQYTARNQFSEEKHDLIDRMQVRSGTTTTLGGRSARKRRRTSGKHRSLKAIRLGGHNGGVHRAAVPRETGQSDRRPISVETETGSSMEDDEEDWEDDDISTAFNDPVYDSFERGVMWPKRQQKLDQYIHQSKERGYPHSVQENSDCEDFVMPKQRNQRQPKRPIHQQTSSAWPKKRKPGKPRRANLAKQQSIPKSQGNTTRTNRGHGGSRASSQYKISIGSQLALPQLFTKPIFKLNTKTDQRQPPSNDGHSSDDFVHEGITVDDPLENPPEEIPATDKGQASSVVKIPRPTGPKINQSLLPPRVQWTHESAGVERIPNTLDPMPNGVYFHHDTYIGRNRLSQLLCAMSSPQALNLDTNASFQLFNEWFLPDWTQPQLFMDGLLPVFYQIRECCATIQEISQKQRRVRTKAEYWRLDINRAKTAVDVCLKTLDIITHTLLVRVGLLSSVQQKEFWSPFIEGFCRSLEDLLDTIEEDYNQDHGAKDNPSRFPDWLFLLNGRWTFVAWAALFERLKADRFFAGRENTRQNGDGYNLTLHRAVDALVRLLIPASDEAFCRRMNRIVAYGQKSTASQAVTGEHVMEMWICLIQVLRQIEDLDQSKDTSTQGRLWIHFNRYIQEEMLGKEALEERERLASDNWTQEKTNHVFRLIVNLCRLHQFDKQGCSDTKLRAHENWILIEWLAKNRWAIGLHAREAGLNAQAVKSREQHFRDLLIYCHRLLTVWDWTPSLEIVMRLCRGFSTRGYADPSIDPGYRMPELVKQLIVRDTSTSRIPVEKQRRIAGVVLDIELLEELMPDHDRCFEIFLKIAGLTILHHVQLVENEQESEQKSSTTKAAPSTGTAGPSSATSSASANETRSRQQACSFNMRECRRLLAFLSPVAHTSFPPSRPPGGPGYSTLCNPCSLLLLTTILSFDSIRPSSIAHMNNFLDFDASDDAAQRIMLQAMTYLGLAWQRQGVTNRAAFPKRQIDEILEFLFSKLQKYTTTYEQDLQAMEKEANAYIPRDKRLYPVASLIEACLGHVQELLMQLDSLHLTPYPALAYLDQRLGVFFDRTKPFPAEMRLQALGVIEKFFDVRKKHLNQVWQQQIAEAAALVAPMVPVPVTNTMQCQQQDQTTRTASLDDDFAFLDDAQFDFDDDFMYSGDSSSQQAEKAPAEVPDEPLLELDIDLVKVLYERVLPWIESLLKERHQLLHAQYQRTYSRFANTPSTTFGRGGAQSRPNNTNARGGKLLSFKKPAVQSVFSPTGVTTSTGIWGAGASSTTQPTVRNNIDQISQHGIQQFIHVLAKANLILFRRGKLTLTEVADRMFKREVWLSVWIQMARQLDELTWATLMLEEQPQLAVGEYEDYFLSLWFSTITTPTSELTLQHRLLRALLQSVEKLPRDNIAANDLDQNKRTGPSVLAELLKDLPFAHLDYTGALKDTGRVEGLAASASTPIDIVSLSIMSVDAEEALRQEFKDSRLQVLLKVLSNMDEHFTRCRTDVEQADPADAQALQQKSRIRYLVRVKYQKYLGNVLRQIKFDYERLQAQRQTRSSIQLVDFAHSVLGHVIQHCGLILQNSSLTGSSDTIFGFLTSPQHFPQPKIDDQFLVQKIRGYAYLHQAGDRQFFSVLLGMIKSQLSKVRGINSHAYMDLRHDTRDLDTRVARTTSEGQVQESKIRIFEDGVLVFPKEDDVAVSNETKPSIENPAPKKDTQNPLRLPRKFQTSLTRFVSNNSEPNKTSPQPSPTENSPLDVSKAALHTLTASLRNTASDTEERCQWSKTFGAFRLMVFISITNPWLVALWGPSRVSMASFHRHPSMEDESLIRRTVPSHPELMIIGASAARTLQDVLHAVAEDIALLPRQSSLPQNDTRLKGYENFHRESSVLFAPIFQALYGTEAILNGAASSLRSLLSEVLLRDPSQPSQSLRQQERLATLLQSSDTRNVLRALHYAGQLLELVGVMVRVARQMRADYPKFWTSASMTEAEQLAHMGSVTVDVPLLSSVIDPNLYKKPATPEVLSLESSLQAFETGYLSGGQYRTFRETTARDLQAHLRPLALEQDAQLARLRHGDRTAGASGAHGGRPNVSQPFFKSPSGSSQSTESNLLKTWDADCLLTGGDKDAENAKISDIDLVNSTVAGKLIRTVQSCIFGFWHDCAMLDTQLYRQGQNIMRIIEDRVKRPESMKHAAAFALSARDEKARSHARMQWSLAGLDVQRVKEARAILAKEEFTQWKAAMKLGRFDPPLDKEYKE
ncbi:hypothetical protein BGW41_006169 [Actinomortierella wolfii]|nr:hypothetical protein BGW41_006169 [Actinomortierella wolfii]